MNVEGTGLVSNVNTGVVLVQSAPITAVTGLNAVVDTATEITLTWNTLLTDADKGYSIITAYQIQMDSGSGFVSLTPNSLDNLGTTISNLVEGKSYYF